MTHDHRTRFDIWRSIESLRKIVSSEDPLVALMRKVDEAIDIANQSRHDEEHILVLPVIPRSLIRHGAVDANLVEDAFKNSVYTPEEPYFLIDVEAGRETLGFPPTTAREIIYRSHRKPLTIDQAVALYLSRPEECPDQILALGSFNPTNPDRTPGFTVRDRYNNGDEVEFQSNPGWGSPSFAAII